MQRLWPRSDSDIDDAALERTYDYPASLERPWVQVNFVSSADGAVTHTGKAAGLSGPADKKILTLGRDLADVVLVGAGTAIVEGYYGIRATTARTKRRERLGLSPVPPVAVVTRRCSVAPDSLLLTDTAIPPIVITCESAPVERRDALTDAGAEVILAGADDVDLHAALAELDQRGLRRINCEGGPRLFGSLIAADLVDELCLTVSPLLVGGDAGRIAAGQLPEAPRRMALESVLHEDGFLMLRYRREQ